jgi:hypothetical protein
MRRKLPESFIGSDYTVNIGAAITSITTAKTGIDLGNENQFQMY